MSKGSQPEQQGQGAWFMNNPDIKGNLEGDILSGLGSIDNLGNISGPDSSWQQNVMDAGQGIYGNILGNAGKYAMDKMTGTADRGALDQVNQDLWAANTTNINENILPSINANAQQAGQVGSSRTGIAGGLAISKANASTSALVNQNNADFQKWNAEQQQQGFQNVMNVGGTALSGLGQYANLSQQMSQSAWIQEAMGTEAGQAYLKMMLKNGMLSGMAGLGTEVM